MKKVLNGFLLACSVIASTAAFGADEYIDGPTRDDLRGGCFFQMADVAVKDARTTALKKGIVPVPEALDGEMQYVEIDTLVVIYTHYYKDGDVRMDLSPVDIDVLESEVEKSRRFLWRSSNLKCLMKTDYLIVNRTLTLDMFWEIWEGAYWLTFWSCDGGATSVEQDLYDAGIVDDQYSVILVLYAFENTEGAGAAYGGACYGVNIGCMGDASYVAIPLCWGLEVNGVVTHEYLHSLDSIFEASGNPGGNDMHHADQAGTFPYLNDCGTHFNFLLSNVLDPGSWLQLYGQWATVTAATDTDEDGVPDTGDLPITEATLGSSSSDQDTDEDGLSDFEELMASYHNESDLLEQDSDGDGLLDGEDPFPLYNYNDHFGRGIPQIDGVIEVDEYTEVTRFNEGDTDISAVVSARWSEGVLYIAADITDDMLSTYYSEPWWCDNLGIMIDAQKDGWFLKGNQNYRFMTVPRGSGGTPDVFGHNFYEDPGNDAWHEIDVSAISAKYAVTTNGYVIELAIPVSVMPGVEVETDASLRLTFSIEDYDTYPGWPTFNVLSGLDGERPGFVYLYLFGGTYYVDDATGNDLWDGLASEWDGTHGPKKTIQAGVDAAAGGEEVAVLEGSYAGPGNRDIDLDGKAIVIRGLGGAANTIIDCGNTARGFYCDSVPAPGAAIHGFTITNGNTSDRGGGIYCSASTLTVENCVVTGNTSTGDGGGICCRESSEVTLTNCLVTGNSGGGKGGGIFCGMSEITISNVTVEGNSSSDFGGGLMMSWGSDGTVRDSILWDNSAAEGSQIALKATAQPSTLSVSYCDVEGGQTGAYVESGCVLNSGSGNLDSDPLFATGPSGAHYLSQTASGQASNSPCVDTGSDTAQNIGLDEMATRTDGVSDDGTVDMGYHASYVLWVYSILRNGTDITVSWNALSGVSYTVQHSTNMVDWTDVPVGETETWTDVGVGETEKYYRVREE